MPEYRMHPESNGFVFFEKTFFVSFRLSKICGAIKFPVAFYWCVLYLPEGKLDTFLLRTVVGFLT